ncbi:Tripartite ATP-independent periplasmic transporter solute receptor, DctP family [uncultured delta proteobacterium]|uniref:Tripartite ATP-independent periplasmic transporter solute receptor, DctP family n=1 Tax=uncultured delta proteobacterium TaxID=34034 RepID=A0A212JCR1_9DELT|nr:Tripartite ATP-independent periplasmic transporter solute receptor, DctP family [uncultured delta proteobacterium]
MKARFFRLSIALCLAVMLFPGAALAKVTLKLGHTGAPNHHYNLTCEQFVEAVKKKSNGEIEIKIFPSDQLGNQRQLVEGAQLGTVDMVLTSDSQISSFVDVFGALNLPFLFRDINHVAKAMDGDVGAFFAKEAEKKGLVIIGYWENGFRHVSNSKRPINKLEDLKGLKLRTPNSQVTLESFKALGALPTPMSFGEIYSALQLGTVDGQENPIAHILTQKWYEVQKYFSLTGHQHNVEPLCMSKVIFDGLKPEYRTILLETGKEYAAVSRKMVTDDEAKQLEELKTKIAVNSVEDMKPFLDACKPVYDDARKKYGAIVDQILAIQ